VVSATNPHGPRSRPGELALFDVKIIDGTVQDEGKETSLLILINFVFELPTFWIFLII
jgi:hypothetical protein